VVRNDKKGVVNQNGCAAQTKEPQPDPVVTGRGPSKDWVATQSPIQFQPAGGPKKDGVRTPTQIPFQPSGGAKTDLVWNPHPISFQPAGGPKRDRVGTQTQFCFNPPAALIGTVMERRTDLVLSRRRPKTELGWSRNAIPL